MIDYSRLEATDFPHSRTKELTVALIGAGALGNAVAQILCLNGVGRLLVVDSDTVSPSDLSRCFFFRRPETSGKNKASALAESAAPFFPDTEIVQLPMEVADADLTMLGNAPLWFSCVDSMMARLEIAYLASLQGRAVIDGALGADALEGRVSWFPVGGACFSCVLPRNLRSKLLTDWRAVPCACGAADDRRPFPSTPSIAATVAGLQVELGLRSYFEQQAQSTTVRMWTKPRLHTEGVSNSVAELCPFHWRCNGRRIMIADNSQSVAEFLRGIGAGPDTYLALEWPQCVRAACSSCGAVFQPMRRLSAVRRNGFCSRCGSRNLQIAETLETISLQSAWAERPLRDFGVRPGLVAVAERRDKSHWTEER